NGRKDPGEPGLGGFTIQLKDDTGKLLGETVTAADGTYSFEGGPPPVQGFGAASAVNVSQRAGYEGEPVIAVDPNDPRRQLVASNTEISRTHHALFTAYSQDGGRTWQGRREIANGGDKFPLADSNPDAVFDEFGNLFLTYLTTDFHIVVLLSTNGGQSF